jgi:voltage-gated potassium channel
VNRTQYLRIISIAGAFLVGFWLPVRMIGYKPPVAFEVAFDLLISVVAGLNIFMFYQSRRSGEIKDVSTSSWIGLALDLICLLPLSVIGLIYFDSSYQSLLLLNLLCARHVRHIKPFLDQFASLQPITYRLVPVAIFLPMLVHLIACGWIALGSGTAGPDPDRLVEYVRAIYWAFTTLTTVGYGDIAAKTPPQMLFTCVVQVCGVGVFGFILSNVASLLSRSDAAREHHMDNLDKIETFMRTHSTPPELRGKIRSYYHYLWKSKKGYSDHSLLEGLPAKIQSELWFHINHTIVERVPFLKGAEKELLEDLMNALEPRIYVPGERIFRVDEPGDALYLVHSGNVEVIGRDNSLIANLGEGAFFGEMALISDKPRSATIRATTYCDIYVLHREAFEKVTTAYPHFRTHLEEVVNRRQAS